MDNRPIGIFDSGLGGLTVLTEIKKRLNKENYIYLGDTKNFPYGNKSKEDIILLCKKNIEFLVQKNVKLIIIACGTATSQALDEVRNLYNIPIIGIIEPTVLSLKKEQDKNNIGVIATEGTIKSGAWEKNIKNNIKNASVINKACPLLAQIAEEGLTNNEVAKNAIKEYMKPFKNKNIDKIILGCTHYPLFEKLIREEIGENSEIINTGERVAIYLEEYLREKNLKNEKANGKQDIYLTQLKENFKEIAEKLLNEKIEIKTTD